MNENGNLGCEVVISGTDAKGIAKGMTRNSAVSAVLAQSVSSEMTRSVRRFGLSTGVGVIRRTEVIVPQEARWKANIPRFFSTGDRFGRPVARGGEPVGKPWRGDASVPGLKKLGS